MLSVRSATTADAADLADLLAQCAVGHPAEGRGPSADWVIDELLDGASQYHFLLAERSGTLAGFAAWRRSHDMLWGVRGADFIWIFVRPAHRGRAVAVALVARVCADVKQDGGQFIWGDTGTPEAARLISRVASTHDNSSFTFGGGVFQHLASLANLQPREIARSLAKFTAGG